MDRTKVVSKKNLVRYLALGGIGFALLGGLTYFLFRKAKNTSKSPKLSKEISIKVLEEIKKGLYPLVKEICRLQADAEKAGRPIPEEKLLDLSKSDISVYANIRCNQNTMTFKPSSKRPQRSMELTFQTLSKH